MKIVKHHFKDGDKEGYQFWFWCPGCNEAHAYTTPPWIFDGNMELPTFTPSLLCNQNHASSRCHLIMTKGKIHYCGDCWHDKKGTVVDMVDVPEWLAGESN